MSSDHNNYAFGNSLAVDETLERLVTMTNQTNLVAIDKVLQSVRRASNNDWSTAAARVGSISERIARAVYEVGMTLPPEQRASDEILM